MSIICFSHIKLSYLGAIRELEYKISVFLTRKLGTAGEFFLNLFFFVEVHRSTPCVQSNGFIPKITNETPVNGICCVEPLSFTSSNSMVCPSK